ncbi:MAG TPA: DUF5937 family protein [Streptosporangiaceae bacterium]
MTTFTARRRDLAAVRFAWSPAWETHLAVRMLIHPEGRPYHRSWHAAVLARAARLDLGALFAVNPDRGVIPDFLAPPPGQPAPRFDDQLTAILATPADQVERELLLCRGTRAGPDRAVLDELLAGPAAGRDLLASQLRAAWDALVAPFWPRLRALLDADVAYRSQQLTDHGLSQLLGAIDPRVSWDGTALIVDDGLAQQVDLAGRGLVLMPSAYIWPHVVAVTQQPWQPAVVYPARGIAGLWQQPAPPPGALVRLLGRTRALLLAGLDQPASTSTLAGRLGLSPSGTSRHLTAMRDAGLLTGTRHRHEIRYARTRLGTALTRAAQRP